MLAQKVRLSPHECNFVATDKLWKDHVKIEKTAAKLYPERWGKTDNQYKDMLDEMRLLPKVDIAMPSNMEFRRPTPIENYIHVAESTRFPKTVSGQIGWRSGKQSCDLEVYGRHSFPQGNIYKRFNWPLDAL